MLDTQCSIGVFLCDRNKGVFNKNAFFDWTKKNTINQILVECCSSSLQLCMEVQIMWMAKFDFIFIEMSVIGITNAINPNLHISKCCYDSKKSSLKSNEKLFRHF